MEASRFTGGAQRRALRVYGQNAKRMSTRPGEAEARQAGNNEDKAMRSPGWLGRRLADIDRAAPTLRRSTRRLAAGALPPGVGRCATAIRGRVANGVPPRTIDRLLADALADGTRSCGR
jgi:hypothetical protein